MSNVRAACQFSQVSGRSRCTTEAQWRDAAVHAVQIHGVNQVGPFERRLRVVHQQCRLAGGVGVAAGERVVVGGEGLDGRQPGALAAPARHSCACPESTPRRRRPWRPRHCQLRQIALAERAARLHHRGDAPVQQSSSICASCGLGALVMALARTTIMARTMSSSVTSGPVPNNEHHRETRALGLLDQRAIRGDIGIAVEHHRLALIAGAAIEPVHRDAFGRGLEQQAIVVGLALLRLGGSTAPWRRGAPP
jgi:hypothetical protein